jgi:glycerophosphoryl diester phosphodiesterase
MHRIDQTDRTLVIAHRGASAHAPENTLAAFHLALDHAADGIELDAKLTVDGHVVVIHDQTVDRTTGAHGLVRQMTLAQLKALDAGTSFAPAFSGEPIPTLAEVFEVVGGRTLINVEITNYASPTDALPDKIADLVIQYQLQESILFSSFHPLNLLRIRRRLPETPAAILTLPGKPGRILRGRVGRWFSPRFIHPYYSDLSAASIEMEHRKNRRINAWTVNEPEDMKRLFKFGIDGIITDDPRLARQVMEER